jgi:ABC-type transporter Mla subunit MlaD
VTTSSVSDSKTVEPTQRTASIIPFPTRTKPADPTPNERLARALVSLNAALAEQRVAVAAWRDVLVELKTATNGLHDSLQRYRTNLRTLGNSVSSLQSKARSLEEWADSVATPTD